MTSSISSWQDAIEHFTNTLSKYAQRQLICLFGSHAWTCERTRAFVQAFSTNETLVYSDAPVDLDTPQLPTGSPQLNLGQEFKLVIWNLNDSVDPNALGVVFGLVEAGGVLLLLGPHQGHFASAPDPSYLSMCSRHDDLERCNTFFLSRFLKILSESPAATLINETSSASDQVAAIAGQTQLYEGMSAWHRSFSEQNQAIASIERVALGRSKRPLVITADRGRGKSAALGLAASRLNMSIVITASRKTATASAFKHYSPLPGMTEAKLAFLPPDELLAQPVKDTLVFVDEAAAIPAPMLSSLLLKFPRIVFASTVHGYEGTGMGFEVRFKPSLDALRPGWRFIHLNEPIRWRSNDLLEHLSFALLSLDADVADVDTEAFSLDEVHYEELEPAALASSTADINDTMGLLVLAHYKTSPSDLRMLLDHPDTSLTIARYRDRIVGVIFSIREDLSMDQALHDEILFGKRRLKGHLLPQSLAYALNDPSPLRCAMQLIVRIDLHPDLKGQGMGSALLSFFGDHCQNSQTVDCMGVSYGFTSALHAFWSNNQFSHVRLGYHTDKSSGSPSVIALRSAKGDSQRIVAWQNIFYQHLCFGLTRFFRDLDWRIVDALLSEVTSVPDCEPELLDSALAYCEERRSEYDALSATTACLVSYIGSNAWGCLAPLNRQVVIRRVLQQHSWSETIHDTSLDGKKAAEGLIRDTLTRLFRP